MGGKAFLIIGGTGRGKSTFARKRLKNVDKRALMIYDVNNEHTDLYDKPFVDFETFINISSKVRNAVLFYEEATIFFSNRGGSHKKMIDILVRKRHTNNTIFLIFHSLRTVPRDIIDLCNYIVLFKTNDSQSLVDSKFKRDDISALFSRVYNAKDHYYHEIYSLY